ncbi:MAG: DUF952 domain-containing protein [Bdellovibrionales bacterium]|nr:DUF952 domain-containing protein [Bdellovibrionales bacterium]
MGLSAFKILREKEWLEFKQNGDFSGSEHDQRDGFIHLSSKDQVERTKEKYFANEDVYIVEFNVDDFGNDIKWEKSSEGIQFPHLYGRPLKVSQMIDYQFVSSSKAQKGD